MDSIGSLVDTNLRIFPAKCLLDYLKTIPIDDNVPLNIAKMVEGEYYKPKRKSPKEETMTIPVHLNSSDIENLNKIKAFLKVKPEDEQKEVEDIYKEESNNKAEKNEDSEKVDSDKIISKCKLNKDDDDDDEEKTKLHLTTADIDWLYTYLKQKRNIKADGDKIIPYLHDLLEGSSIETPENQVIKRNPVLEARCVLLRSQQEAREYRAMTKSVDNVRMRYPEDSISYQLKQINRHLIAIAQFIITIFSGFLFGFKGIEWLVGNIDFGFRLLLGVMCALVMALAEIYFLAKELNQELDITENVQLGGPNKFAKTSPYVPPISNKANDKEHQD